jgi:hypothetical protein
MVIVPLGFKCCPQRVRYATYHNTTIEYTSHDSCSGAGGLGERHTSSVESRIAVVVGEVEARHFVIPVIPQFKISKLICSTGPKRITRFRKTMVESFEVSPVVGMSVVVGKRRDGVRLTRQELMTRLKAASSS